MGYLILKPRFSNLVADADLDIGARAILTTNLSLLEGSYDYMWIQNRAKTIYKHLSVSKLAVAGTHKAGLYTEYTTDAGITIDGLLIKDSKIQEFDGIAPWVMAKVASDNVRNSHNAEVSEANIGTGYVKVKTVTFTNGIKGTLRVTWEMKVGGTTPGYGRLYKNGVALGTPQANSDGAYTGTPETEDVDVGTVAAGETLELWVAGSDATTDVWAKNFRLSYDDENGVPVSVNS